MKRAGEGMGQRFFRRCVSRAAGIAGLCMAVGPAAAREARPPNIVMIVSDDQGWGDYGFMGHPAIRTPNLDRLAGESLLFTRGYVTAPLCCPSLASMLSGQYPHEHRIATNDPNMPAGVKRATARVHPEVAPQLETLFNYYREAPMLPRVLAPRGYASFQAGKWWGSRFDTAGFTEGMTHGDPLRGGRHGDEGLTIGRVTMNPVFDFIDRHADRPFLLWYAPMLPHSPHNPPERLLAKYRDRTPSIHVARYWAMCEWFDETCGALLEHLDRRGLRDDTMVLYLCDNGWIPQQESPSPDPRSKSSRFDGGLRTPIMVRWPGRVKPRRDDSTLVSSIDLAPTVLTACGVESSVPPRGVNLLDRDALQRRDAVFGVVNSHDAVDIARPETALQYRWMVEGRWKLILPYRPNRPRGTVELYDVTADPTELHNRAADERARVEAMRRRIEAWWPLEDAAAPLFPEPLTPSRKTGS